MKNPKIANRLMEVAFSRYWQTAALFGTHQDAVNMVEKLKHIGVGEIACLIDFGIKDELVMDGLHHLLKLAHFFSK
ncbi:hypothetical protein D3C78_1902300 [compost metagenome]